MKGKRLLVKLFTSFLSLAMLLSGCSGGSTDTSDDAASSSAVSVSQDIATLNFGSEEYDIDWLSQSHTAIDLSDGPSTITKSGIYVISGTLEDGSLTVDVDNSTDEGTIYLVLNGASISSSDSAPIYIMDGEKVVIVLMDGTENTVYQGSGVEANADGEPSAAIFSKSDLTITGTGKLSVTSEYNDGITSKDDLYITGGTIIIDAVQDGIVGKDLLAVENASITIAAGKDGMRSTNETDAGRGNIIIAGGTFDITSACDGLDAVDQIQIAGGIFTITTGGGYTGTSQNGMDGNLTGHTWGDTATDDTDTDSLKGLKGRQGVTISGGTFTISAADDTIHSNGDISISGGSFAMQSNDDGIHSDTTLTVSGGTINIKNCYEGLEAANITVNDGDIDVTSSDDGFNINASGGVLTINGGDIYMNSGGDGLDSNGSITMTGGTVYVDGPTANDNGALDYQNAFTITGGTLIASGSSGMAQAPESGSQASILMYYTSTQAADSTITLKDGNGNVVATVTPSKRYASVVISTPELATGSTYTLYSGSTKVVTFTTEDTVTYLTESGVTTQQGVGGGQPGLNQGGNSGGRGR